MCLGKGIRMIEGACDAASIQMVLLSGQNAGPPHSDPRWRLNSNIWMALGAADLIRNSELTSLARRDKVASENYDPY
jgi:hypothetical protein